MWGRRWWPPFCDLSIIDKEGGCFSHMCNIWEFVSQHHFVLASCGALPSCWAILWGACKWCWSCILLNELGMFPLSLEPLLNIFSSCCAWLGPPHVVHPNFPCASFQDDMRAILITPSPLFSCFPPLVQVINIFHMGVTCCMFLLWILLRVSPLVDTFSISGIDVYFHVV